jgi:hypothetical protein
LVWHTNLIVLAVKTGAAGVGAKGISLVVVETKDLQGYRVGRTLEKVGMHGQDTCELFFDDLRPHGIFWAATKVRLLPNDGAVAVRASSTTPPRHRSTKASKSPKPARVFGDS